jgi:hypothetical protein
MIASISRLQFAINFFVNAVSIRYILLKLYIEYLVIVVYICNIFTNVKEGDRLHATYVASSFVMA